MTKRNSDTVGTQIDVTKEDNLLLKQYFVYAYAKGVTKSNREIRNEIFSRGLHELTRHMKIEIE
jgi:hypothetical protein